MDSVSTFRARYGPWAVVAGGSAGIGAAFANELARRGINVAPVARRADELNAFARHLHTSTGVEVRPIQLDLARSDAPGALSAALDDVEVGLLVYNAALSLVGPFLRSPIDDHLRELQVNCTTPLQLVHRFATQMVARQRGGIVLMSSLAGFQGSPLIAHYAATKAYSTTLAEGLWAELHRHGVDVIACCAGATATPGYLRTARSGRFEPRPLQPDEVASEALRALGKRATHIPGRANRVASFIMRRVLPRTAAIRLMERSTRALEQSPHG